MSNGVLVYIYFVSYRLGGNHQLTEKTVKIYNIMSSFFRWRQSPVSNDASLNLRWWRHFEITSLRLFSSFAGSWKFAISNFSVRHRWHLPDSRLNAGAVRIIFHEISGLQSLVFSRQNSVDNVVLFLYFSWLNDFLWLAYLFLNVVSQSPMYSYGIFTVFSVSWWLPPRRYETICTNKNLLSFYLYLNIQLFIIEHYTSKEDFIDWYILFHIFVFCTRLKTFSRESNLHQTNLSNLINAED